MNGCRRERIEAFLSRSAWLFSEGSKSHHHRRGPEAQDKRGKAAENKGGPSSPQEKSLEKGNGRQALIQEALRLFNGKIVEE